jgi:hypothetical protein
MEPELVGDCKQRGLARVVEERYDPLMVQFGVIGV